MRIVITGVILVFALIHHQAMKERHGLIQVASLEIGIAHIELQLLRLIGGEGESIRLLVNSQGVLVFLVLEQVVGIQEIGMTRPSATWVVVHELDDFGRTVGLTEIEGADGFIVLCVDTALRLGIGGLSTILGKSGKRGAIFLVFKQQDSFVEEGLRVIGFDMLLR